MQMIALILVPLFALASPIKGTPLPSPSDSKVQFSRVVGWKPGEKPIAPAGFNVTRFADAMDTPRWIYADPSSSDLFVAESSVGRVTLFRDKDGDGKYETRVPYATGLNKPFGMAIAGSSFYIATQDAVWKYAYSRGDLKLSSPGAKIATLPTGGYNNHWTRNLLLSKDGKRLYVTVGSGSNVGEHGMPNEKRRANILSINLDGSDEKIVASGLRNPVGLDYASDGTLWTAVNERDGMGDQLVPDYITSVKDGGFYGWPYFYYGTYQDPNFKTTPPDLKKRAVTPDVALGAHTASLGLAFYSAKEFPAKYHGGAFIGQHGSWNSSKFVGYRVAFVPFDAKGKPTGGPEDFLTGFVANEARSEVHGRPVGVTVMHDGSLLVVDDGAGIIWRVTH